MNIINLLIIIKKYEKAINDNTNIYNKNKIDYENKLNNLNILKEELKEELNLKQTEIEKLLLQQQFSNDLIKKEFEYIELKADHKNLIEKYNNIETPNSHNINMIKYKCLVYNNLFIVLYDVLEAKKK